MRFFLYGTLMAGSGNRMARLVEARLRPLGPATARGLLHAIPDPRGWYPALMTGEGEVRGMLYEAGAGFGEADLAKFDAYEDYDPSRPEASLYWREMVEVLAADGGIVPAHAYRYVRSLPDGARPIPRGDFAAWLDEQGLEPFRPGSP